MRRPPRPRKRPQLDLTTSVALAVFLVGLVVGGSIAAVEAVPVVLDAADSVEASRATQAMLADFMETASAQRETKMRDVLDHSLALALPTLERSQEEQKRRAEGEQ